MASTAAHVRKVYREIIAVAKSQSNKSTRDVMLKEARTKFRAPLIEGETVEGRLKLAEDRLAFLRIQGIAGKPRGTSQTDRSGSSYLYKDGERLESSGDCGTLRDSKGRVVSNWNGSNLDPESVTRHKQNLTRCGFVNNQHAKGIF